MARDISPLMTEKKPHVLIVGAGLSGLLLAVLLERADMSYEIFERRKEFRPVGSAVFLSASILPVFEQIGLYDALMKISLPLRSTRLYDDNLNEVDHGLEKVRDNARVTLHWTQHSFISTHHLWSTIRTEIYCSPELLRPENRDINMVVLLPSLYRLLYNQIPPHKIRTSKRIISLLQNNEGVMIRAADCTYYHVDILVGADGAHSSVRQNLYKYLEQKGVIPTQQTCMVRSHNILAGVRGPLDSQQYPGVDDEHSNLTFMQPEGTPRSWVTFTVRNNAICWAVLTPITDEQSKENLFHSSLWGPQAYDLMTKEVYEFKTIYGKLGDLIDQTPRESVYGHSRKTALFDTWHHGRTILIGDAVHQTGPFDGSNILHAVQDAVALANCIYDIKRSCYIDISAALEDFTDLRFPQLRAHFVQHSMNPGIKKTFFNSALR